jgi:hypothetical protein
MAFHCLHIRHCSVDVFEIVFKPLMSQIETAYTDHGSLSLAGEGDGLYVAINVSSYFMLCLH